MSFEIACLTSVCVLCLGVVLLGLALALRFRLVLGFVLLRSVFSLPSGLQAPTTRLQMQITRLRFIIATDLFETASGLQSTGNVALPSHVAYQQQGYGPEAEQTTKRTDTLKAC